MNNRQHRIAQLAACAALCAFPFSSSVAEDKAVIKIASPGWDAGAIIARKVGSVITKNSDFDVEYVSIKSDILWTELEKENGKIDIFPDLWKANQQQFWDEYVEERNVVLYNQIPYSGEQGFYAYLPDGVSVEDLSVLNMGDPKIVEIFDSDQNGKAEYWPGADGWHSTLYNQVKIKDYDLQDKWERLDASNDEFLNVFAERARSSKAMMFYYWKPDALHAEFPLVEVEEEVEFTIGCRDFVEPTDDDEWLAKSTFKCAYEASPIHVIFRADLFSEHEELLKLLRDFKVDPDKLQHAMLQYKNKKMSLEESASLLN